MIHAARPADRVALDRNTARPSRRAGARPLRERRRRVPAGPSERAQGQLAALLSSGRPAPGGSPRWCRALSPALRAQRHVDAPPHRTGGLRAPRAPRPALRLAPGSCRRTRSRRSGSRRSTGRSSTTAPTRTGTSSIARSLRSTSTSSSSPSGGRPSASAAASSSARSISSRRSARPRSTASGGGGWTPCTRRFASPS